MTCCHCRLLKEIFPVLCNKETVVSPFINVAKLLNGITFADSPVLELNSKVGCQRYSVVAGSSVEFVTVFSVAKSSRKIVQCHASLCKIREGSSRNVQTLVTSQTLCPHLAVFKIYYLSHNSDAVSDANVGEDREYDNEASSELPQEKV